MRGREESGGGTTTLLINRKADHSIFDKTDIISVKTSGGKGGAAS